MKANIHPTWYQDALITCACGNTFKIGSTREEIRVEICSRCHPYFTGEMRFADTVGKVDRFRKQIEVAKQKAPALAKKRAKKKGRPHAEDTEPKSLKEMLLGA
ncbi:50S ribosomal protein L31 [Candidatus Gottesmanbacteria bacterium]|nr:50S ribosomal protein L31 [Candidatus Gottesmanbacteria bacterium]